MNYLLDTHAFVWSLMEPDKIPNRIKKIIQDTQNNIMVSIVSFWEISIKYGLGKIKLNGVTPEELPLIAEKNNFAILILQPQDAAAGHHLSWMGNHKDPFDRILIWQAIQNDLTIVSMDADFHLYRSVGLKLIW